MDTPPKNTPAGWSRALDFIRSNIQLLEQLIPRRDSNDSPGADRKEILLQIAQAVLGKLIARKDLPPGTDLTDLNTKAWLEALFQDMKDKQLLEARSEFGDLYLVRGSVTKLTEAAKK